MQVHSGPLTHLVAESLFLNKVAKSKSAKFADKNSKSKLGKRSVASQVTKRQADELVMDMLDKTHSAPDSTEAFKILGASNLFHSNVKKSIEQKLMDKLEDINSKKQSVASMIEDTRDVNKDLYHEVVHAAMKIDKKRAKQDKIAKERSRYKKSNIVTRDTVIIDDDDLTNVLARNIPKKDKFVFSPEKWQEKKRKSKPINVVMPTHNPSGEVLTKKQQKEQVALAREQRKKDRKTTVAPVSKKEMRAHEEKVRKERKAKREEVDHFYDKFVKVEVVDTTRTRKCDDVLKEKLERQNRKMLHAEIVKANMANKAAAKARKKERQATRKAQILPAPSVVAEADEFELFRTVNVIEAIDSCDEQITFIAEDDEDDERESTESLHPSHKDALFARAQEEYLGTASDEEYKRALEIANIRYQNEQNLVEEKLVEEESIAIRISREEKEIEMASVNLSPSSSAAHSLRNSNDDVKSCPHFTGYLPEVCELCNPSSSSEFSDDGYCIMCGALIDIGSKYCKDCTWHPKECTCFTCKRALHVQKDYTPTSLGVEYTSHTKESDFATYLRGALQAYKDVEYFVDLALNLASFMTNMYNCCNGYTAAASVYMYIGTFGVVDTHYKFIMASCAGITISNFKILKARFIGEGLSDEIADVSALITKTFDANIIASIRELVGTCAAFRFCDSKEDAMKIYDLVGKPKVGGVTWVSLCTTVLDTVAAIMRVGEMLVQGQPLTKALFSDDPTAAAIEEAADLLRFKDRLYDGIYHPGEMDRKEFRMKAVDLITFFEHQLKVGSKRSQIGSKMKILLSDLQLAVASIDAATKAQSRIPPVFMLITGTPGIGKSTIRAALYMLFMDVVKGKKFERSHVYSKQLSSDFWEGYKDQYIVAVSELGNETKKISESQTITFYKELCSLADAEPYLLNMAFEGKGKTYCLADAIFADSNNPTLNLEYQIKNVGAWMRRMLRLSAVVKPKYRKANSNEIDFNLCNDGSYVFDRWYFNLEKFTTKVSESADGIFLLEASKKHDIYDLFNCLTALWKKHFQDNAKVKALVDEAIAIGPVSRPMTKAEGHTVFDDDYDPAVDGKPQGVRKTPDQLLQDSILKERREKLKCKDTKDCDCMVCVELYSLNLKPTKMNALRTKINDWKENFLDRIHDFKNGTTLIFDVTVAGVKAHLSNYLVEEAKDHRNHTTVLDFSHYRCLIWSSIVAPAAIMFAPLSLPFVSIFPFINYRYVAASLLVDKASKSSKEHRSTLSVKWAMLKAWWNRVHFFAPSGENSKLMAFIKLACTMGGFALGYFGTRYLLAGKPEVFEENANAFAEEIQKEEERFDAYQSSSQVPLKETVEGKPKPPMHYNTMRPIYGIPAHTGTIDTLLRAVYRNVRSASLEFVRDGVAKTVRTYVLGLDGNVALINTHCLPNSSESFRISISQSGYYSECLPMLSSEVNPTTRLDLKNDQTLILLSGVSFASIWTHVNGEVNFPKRSKGKIAKWDIVAAPVSETPLIESANRFYSIKDAIVYEWAEHLPGMCGLPIIGELATGFVVHGIHSAGSRTTKTCYATRLHREFLQHKCLELIGRTNLHPIIGNSIEEIKTEEPIAQSSFRYIHAGTIEYHGKLPGEVKVKRQTALTRLIPPEVLKTMFESAGIPVEGIEHRYGTPLLQPCWKGTKYLNPYNNGLVKMACAKIGLNRDILSQCVSKYASYIINGLRANGVTKIRPSSLDDAINGSMEDENFDRINVSTAAGYGYPGKKVAYLPIDSIEPNRVTRTANPELTRTLLNMYKTYGQRRRNTCIFNVCLKDEPRLFEKIAAGKTRLFMAMGLNNVIMSRQFLGPLFALMSTYNRVFKCAIGINMYSEAGKIYESIDENILEGDYGAYDQTMPFDISWAAGSVMRRVLVSMGYNNAAIQVVDGILSELLFPTFNMLQDLFTVPGMQPSGTVGTAQTNSIKNVLLLMYYWYSHPALNFADFFDHVDVWTFGDDLLGKVSDFAAPYLDCQLYSKFCKEVYGMEFTTSSKGAVTEKFISRVDMSFLKRKFIYHDDVQRIVAPLAMESIYKMLEWTEPSKTEPRESQIASTLGSACTEMFFHVRREQYDLFRASLIGWYTSEILDDLTFVSGIVPTYDFLVGRYSVCPSPPIESESFQAESSECPCAEEDFFVHESVEGGRLTMSCDPASDVTWYTSVTRNAPYIWFRNIPNMPRPAWSQKIMTRLTYHLFELEREEKELNAELTKLKDVHNGRSLHVIISDREYKSKQSVRNHYAEVVRIMQRLASVEQTISLVKRALASHAEFHAEADENEAKVTERIQNVLESHGTEMDDMEMSFSVLQAKDTDMDLNDYIERFVLIFSHQFDLDTDTLYDLPVWDVLSLDPNIRAKLHGYSLFRADLELRIRLIGTKFHQGGIVVSSLTAALMNDVWQKLVSLPSAYRNLLITYLTSIPGHQFLNANEDSEIVMTMPFFFPHPMLRLYNGDSTEIIADTDSYADMRYMQHLALMNVTNLTASGATAPTKIPLQIYARFKNVILSAPTGTVQTLRAESDEREKGPVERMSSSMASFLGHFRDIPVIGPYAQASQLVTKGMSKLASLFGWSVPNVVTSPVYVKNEPFRNGCQTIVHTTEKRLTVDPKQGLLVDPRFANQTEDELTLAFICRQPSMVLKATWTVDTPTQEALIQWPVHPMLGAVYSSAFQPSNLAFAATPFRYWSGDITFKIRAWKTGFVRGVMNFYWEPNTAQFALMESNLNLQKQCIAMMDLATEDEITFTVEYAKYRAWSSVSTDEGNLDLLNPSYVAPDENFNGIIAMVPLMELTSNGDTPVDFTIECWSENMRFNWFTCDQVTSRFIDLSAESEEKTSINPLKLYNEHRSDHYFGEQPMSFRALLHRFMTAVVPTGPIVNGFIGTVDTDLRNVPIIGQAIDTNAYDENPQTLISYLRYAYAAMRGGVMRRLSVAGRDFQTQELGRTTVTYIAKHGSSDAVWFQGEPSSYMQPRGTVAYLPWTNSGIEYEVPWYKPQLFDYSFSNSGNLINPPYVIDEQFLTHNVTIDAFVQSGYLGTITLTGYSDFATGEDFTLANYVAPPLFLL